jgi:hypothetical protein
MKDTINRIITKNPAPDQSLLPEAWLFWDTAREGRVYLNCHTGQKHKKLPEDASLRLTWTSMKNNTICTYSGADLRYAYCKYHSKEQLLELSVVEMSTRRTDGPRKWEYAKDSERYFLDISKNIYDKNGRKEDNRFYGYTWHEPWGFHNYISMLDRLNYNDNFFSEFKKLIGMDSVVVGNGRCLKFEYLHQIKEWYLSKRAGKTNGKAQKLLDEVTSLPHSDVSDICKRYPVKEYKPVGYSWARRIANVVYFERLNDTWSVLRWCDRKVNDESFESYRVYISEKGDCKMAKINDLKEWVPAQNKRDTWYSAATIVNFDDMAKCKRLSYIMPMLKEIDETKQLPHIVSIIRFPEVEKLYKMGYKDFAETLLSDYTVNANIKNTFGKVNKKAKTIYGEFGLNKYQFDKYINACNIEYDYNSRYELYGSHYKNCIVNLKTIFGDDISHMDNDTFDKLLLCIARIHKYKNWRRNMLTNINDLHIDAERFLKNLARLSEKHGESEVRLVRDTMDLYTGISEASRPEIDWIFDSHSDIVRVHDALTEIKRIEDAERRALWDMDAAERRKKEDEKRKKIDEKRQQYEYEEDEYIIRLPKDCNEIVDEGVRQHICIGGYTSSHSNGSTNLFFLRKKSESNIPFYAIEMNNDKKIVQIHGFGNKWLGNDPEAIPTVVRWLRKNDITCDKKILLCTAKGYGSNAQYIEMPVVD